MSEFSANHGEIQAESSGFLAHFNALPDPRQPGKVIYPLDEVLLLCLMADSVLALKDNPGSLREDGELFGQSEPARDFAGTQVSQFQSVGGEHGRIETRTTPVIHDVAWLQKRHAWPGLKSGRHSPGNRPCANRTGTFEVR
jgi:hypothetical protein